MMKDNLRKWRRLARMSQEKLADEMQVSRQTISKWENGKTYPSTGHVLELAKILGCGVDELMGRSVKYDVDGSIGGKTKREMVELTSAEHEGNETNVDVLCDGAVDVRYNGISRTRHNETSSVRCGRIVFWMNSVAIAIMMLVGVSGIVTGCFLHDGVRGDQKYLFGYVWFLNF